MVHGQISHGSKEISKGKSEVACARTRKSKNPKICRKFPSDFLIRIIDFVHTILAKISPNDGENPLQNACLKKRNSCIACIMQSNIQVCIVLVEKRTLLQNPASDLYLAH